MTTVIEHVRHVVVDLSITEDRFVVTACGRLVLGLTHSTRDTEHHQPARSRCAECLR